MTKLYDGTKCIGKVEHTTNLDHWDGNNYTSGSTGKHLGIGQLKDGRYYLCYGTQWQGEQDYAEVISEEEARHAVISHGDNRLFAELFNEEIPDLTA